MRLLEIFWKNLSMQVRLLVNVVQFDESSVVHKQQ